ncbi:tRNA (adenosine(37)-N6)-threonylcarbamoyltransferase complex dimerization subunit type 1 TsaB [Sphingomonas sp. LY29]|uniref:tRNA (adenosine(37)-N6)-threonylcarbamoyltransferase complex dimerization subunit type 1 TsaB n=1 Tax=Sphingomonas sp. LY29 TaxID=3095341 RepID=UPI002D76DA6E|nr:tRNA (adenosine(37)-N6)-threonylcarbamoyltransferase complex dimerization subunit type 1 TsaB [Sphingomonas sp. LY29]WRP26686.1 tRNA (adenosine(37)-N6)-threonylcarbamoyltransferase complex dimerization subunit type 1 TsaB [Sphingomonas sp. LY29]
MRRAVACVSIPSSANGRFSLILAIDTSTAACTAALLTSDGTIIAERDEQIGRGHAERLVPMISEMIEGHVPTRLLVGVGPGSFTGLRVGIAAAHGLAVGWNIPLAGMNSLALIAATAPDGDRPVTVAVTGGHGELFVQTFRRPTLDPTGVSRNLTPAEAAAKIDTDLVVGSGAEALVAARGSGTALPLMPSASRALRLPELLRMLDCKPHYGRAPDARPRAA